MADLKPIIVAVMSVEAGEAGEAGKGNVLVRITNPYADTDFYMRVPVTNLNESTHDVLKEARRKVYDFATALALAADTPLRFSQ
jgi:hypothetical protein